VWATLSTGTTRQTVARRDIPVLSRAGEALHVALHAAKHRRGHAVADLERALEQVPRDTWRQAAELAVRLEGAAAFRAGLCLLPAGRKLAAHLGVADAWSTESSLRAAQVPLAEGLHELWSTPSARAQLLLVRRELFPRPAFMRWWTPLARRGLFGLAAAYPLRLAYLASRLPRAAWAVYTARRGGFA
jgi:hypothetical protein